MRWSFHTLDNSESYIFEFSPNKADNPWAARSVTWHYGQRSGYSGTRTSRTPVQWSFSGTIREHSQYLAFLHWLDKQTKIRVLTDLGENHLVRLLSFEPTQTAPKRNPYRFTYTVKALVYDEVGTRPVKILGPLAVAVAGAASVSGGVGTGLNGEAAAVTGDAPLGSTDGPL